MNIKQINKLIEQLKAQSKKEPTVTQVFPYLCAALAFTMSQGTEQNREILLLGGMAVGYTLRGMVEREEIEA